jgi:branched-chain amino acid transport system permease protein
LLVVVLRPLLGSAFVRLLFRGGLAWYTAVAIFLIAFGFSLFWQSRGTAMQTRYRTTTAPYQKQVRYGSIGMGGIILLLLPWVLGTFLSEVLDNVGLYILMALGLNMAVGLAGLLDLGYVANFAVGAYVAAIFTTTGDQSIGQLSFWLVIPLSIIAAMITGFLLALPVLRMRGDYLAITTLGFGEIIRILVLSDWLAPYIGGTQGVQDIPNPTIFGFAFSRPEHFYYLILAGCLVALFVSVRLNNSRTGRQWMALREDEDVAAAMGIDTVLTKLLAFTLSAATGGLAGAIFAAKLSTTFPQSFTLLVSINVLSIIIVGGMGSVPGIVLGAFVLIGAPELLREFQEYRLLIYGALLILVMLLRPEGLWPSAVRRRELHDVMDETAALGVPHSEVISHGQTVEARRMD